MMRFIIATNLITRSRARSARDAPLAGSLGSTQKFDARCRSVRIVRRSKTDQRKRGKEGEEKDGERETESKST